MQVFKISDTGQQIIQTKAKLKEIIEHPIPAIYRQEHTTVFNHLFTRCQTHMRAKGGNFQNLLQQMVTYNNTDC
jgi:hypothetical protein